MKNKLARMFMNDAYAVAIRKANTDEAFQIKYPTVHEWWADPFVCHHEGVDYCFVELMSSYRLHGEIAVAVIKDGVIGDFQVVISEPFHMSFPNVFYFDGQWYMLPETNHCQQVRLYKSTNFPYEWELDAVLCTNERLVDHALLPADDGFYMVSNDITNEAEAYNRFFYLDMKQKKLTEHFPQGDYSNIRPGGSFYRQGAKWRHVLQDGVRAYGDYLHVYEVDEFNAAEFKEHKICSIHTTDLKYNNDNGVLEHIHTYNRNEKYEVIDLQYAKVYPHKFFIHWYHEYLKHIKKNWK